MEKKVATPKKRRAPKSKTYFGSVTEEAIRRFKDTIDPEERKHIYEKEIHPVFLQLTIKLIRKMKITSIPTTDLQCEAVSHLYCNGLAKEDAGYDPSKGRAFSYFTRSTFNFLLGKQQQMNKRRNKKAQLDEIDTTRDLAGEMQLENQRDTMSAFMDVWCAYYEHHLENFFPRDRSRKIADAVVALFRSRESIDIFNKKALYVMIRERSGCQTNEITSVVKVIKDHYAAMFSDYVKTGFIRSADNY